MKQRGVKSKKIILSATIIVFGIILCMLAGCGKKEMNPNEKSYTVYMLNREQTKLIPFEYLTDTNENSQLLRELLDVMSKNSDDASYSEVIKDFMVTAYSIKDNVIDITVNRNYKNLLPTTEVLTRAAIVRTLCQMDGIDYVMMKVEDEELKNHDGTIVGIMDEKQFLDNAGNEINTYENVDLSLYFASKDGEHLIKAIRPVEYSSNISIEKLLMEKLIGGPVGEGLYATINPNTKIENITVKDGICYVNLSKEFLQQHSNVTPEVAIYSVVNTLVELENVNRVQISIQGETDILFRDALELTTLYTRNLDLVMKKE